MKKVLFTLFLLIYTYDVYASENTLSPNARSAIMIESNTGEVIYEVNSHEKLSPASMTKMMSLLLIMEAIDNDVIKLNDMVTVSKNAASMGGSQILLEEGEVMSVDDLLKGVAIASGNDAVVAIAEKIAGTEEEFVRMMNEKANELGLKDTHFKNCHGLDSEGHYSSAYDMAIIARELVKHEKIFDYSSIYETYLRSGTKRQIWLVNTNKLVKFKKGVDGLKTGYTTNSLYCLTATMKVDDMRIIAVVMGEPSSDIRNQEVSSMLDYAFANYGVEKFLSKNRVIDEITLDNSDERLEVVPIDDLSILYKKKDKYQEPDIEIEYDKIKLPIKKGDIIGRIKLVGDKENIVELTTNKDINKLSIYNLFKKYMKKVIVGDISF